MTQKLAIRSRPSTRQLLTCILEAPDLAVQVQSLPPKLLAELIERIGRVRISGAPVRAGREGVPGHRASPAIATQ